MVYQDSLSLILIMKIHSHLWTPKLNYGRRRQRGVDLGGDFLVRKCKVPNAMGGSGPTPLRGRSRLSKVHQGGVQSKPGPSDTKGFGPLRNCQADRCARLDRGLARGRRVRPGRDRLTP